MDREQWRAILEHDRRYDGKLFYGHKKGNTVCRPSWDIGNIEPDKIVVFTSLEEAKKFGYQPCSCCLSQEISCREEGNVIVARAKRYIAESYREKFSLNRIAGRLYVNPSYLCRAFKKETNKTLLTYCNEMRCREAKALLTRSELCVSYIAVQVGFCNASQFCRVFKSMEGKTPCQYRREYFYHLKEKNEQINKESEGIAF